MGVDIHIFVTRDNEVIHREIYDGRNYEWFDNLQGHGWNEEYDNLPNYRWNEEVIPSALFKEYGDTGTYYGHYYMTVKDFEEWFVKYEPYKHAGWVTTYDKWRMETKGWIPEEINHYLSKDDILADMHFVEYCDDYDPSLWLYRFLAKENVASTDIICYCFDN